MIQSVQFMSIVTHHNTNELAVFDQNMVDDLAKTWVNLSAEVKNTDHVLIYFDINGRQLAKSVAKECSKIGARVNYRIRDLDMDSVLLKHQSDRDIARYYSFANVEVMESDVVFIIRSPRTNDILASIPSEKMKLHSTAIEPIINEFRVDHTRWELLYWPTISDSEAEGMSLEEYSKLFFNACLQPWEEIAQAQEILVEVLNNADNLTLIANPNDSDATKRTHLEMSIKGMNFVNSTIKRNFPGSEVFSAPIKASVNGQLYAPGKKMLAHESKLVENVYMKIKDGVIINASATHNEKDMLDLLDRDKGARYFGEIALGTNPGLRKQLLNRLMNEKVGGSFHITPGASYHHFENFKGEPIDIYNGNDSLIHWDITISMLPSNGGGEVIVDGKTIQKDGAFLLPGLEILNKGL